METKTYNKVKIHWIEGLIRLEIGEIFIDMDEKSAAQLATALATAANGSKVIGNNKRMDIAMEIPE